MYFENDLQSESQVAMVDEVIADGRGERRWPRALRTLYREEFGAKRLKEVRFLHALGLAVTLGCVGLDFTGGLLVEGIVLRWLVGGLVFGVAILAPPSRISALETLRAIGPIIVTLAIAAILATLAPPQYTDRYLMGGGFFIAMAITILPLRITEHIALGALGFLVLIGPVLTSRDIAVSSVSDIYLFVALCCLGPLAIARRTIRLRDQNFILTLRARIAQEELLEANSALRHLSERDPLTGLFNRRSFAEQFDAAFRAALADDRSLGLMMVDIDHFKAFNDRHGHPAGDRCLKTVARSLSRTMSRSQGIVGRYGGEEFIVAMPVADQTELLTIAENVRRGVAIVRTRYRGRKLPSVSVSVGATIGSRICADLETLLQRADEALYDAKERGRNRCEVWATGPC